MFEIKESFDRPNFGSSELIEIQGMVEQAHALDAKEDEWSKHEALPGQRSGLLC